MQTGTQDNGGAKPQAESAEQRKKRTVVFMEAVAASAGALLNEWVGEERAAEARGRVVAAFQASAMAAKKPDDFYGSTLGSVALCVAAAALTGMMPGTGASALAYLVPRRPRKGEQPQLQFQLSHRGLCALARRAGLVLVAIPAGLNDALAVTEGEVSTFAPNIDDPPMAWDDLRGVVVIAKDARTGATLFRGWVAKKLIAARRDSSDSFTFAEKEGNEWAKRTDPWHVWPVEMAMKCALHYAVSRGWAVIDDTEAMRALSIDAAADVIDVEGEVVKRTPVGGPLGDLGLKKAPPELPAPPIDDDPLAGIDEQVERDKAGEGKLEAKPPEAAKPEPEKAARKARPKPEPAPTPAPTPNPPSLQTADELAEDIAKGRNRRALLNAIDVGIEQLGTEGAMAVAAKLGITESNPIIQQTDEVLAELGKALSVEVDRMLDLPGDGE